MASQNPSSTTQLFILSAVDEPMADLTLTADNIQEPFVYTFEGFKTYLLYCGDKIYRVKPATNLEEPTFWIILDETPTTPESMPCSEKIIYCDQLDTREVADMIIVHTAKKLEGLN